MSAQSDLHNQIVGPIVSSIVKPPIEAGGSVTDVMVVLESVVLGVMIATGRLGMSSEAVDVLAKAVKRRLCEVSALDGEPAGRA